MVEQLQSPRPHRGRAGWVAALILVPLAAVALVASLNETGAAAPAAAPVPAPAPAQGPPGLRAQLAAQVTGILEQASTAEHHDHGHHFGEEDGRIVCAVDPFGTEPADAHTLAEVEWVYAHHLCAITGAGGSWAQSVRASGPLAVRLGDHPTVRLPQQGGDYPGQVRKVIPERYHEQAFGEFADPAAIDAARDRFSNPTSP